MNIYAVSLLFFVTCHAMEQLQEHTTLCIKKNSYHFLNKLPKELWQQILESVPGDNLFLHQLMYCHNTNNEPVCVMTDAIAETVVDAIREKNEQLLKRCYDKTLWIYFNKKAKTTKLLTRLQNYLHFYASAPQKTQEKLITAFVPFMMINDTLSVHYALNCVQKPVHSDHCFKQPSSPNKMAFLLLIDQNFEFSTKKNGAPSLIGWTEHLEKIVEKHVPELHDGKRDMSNCYIQ